MSTTDALADYHRMRDFAQTPEPRGGRKPASAASRTPHRFVVQEHHARSLHYDFRLELDGTLKSWAVPKGPSLDPAVKRMAVQVEDHPVAYADFEGEIPKGHYGAGQVQVWDRGSWTPVGDARAGLRDGHLKFDLAGAKLRGRWALVRMKPRDGERQPAWLLMKERDAPAQAAASEAPAPRAALPARLSPQLATLVDTVPADRDAWSYEIKFDGYRLLVRVDAKAVRCLTRNGHDWTDRVPALVEALRTLKLPPCWLDGELVMLDAAGVPDFQALQNAFDAGRTADLVYFAFDLPYAAGRDLRDLPLQARRQQLREWLARAPASRIRFSENFAGDPATLLASAREAGLEGLIAKRVDSPYRSARSADWVKLKTRLRQEFVIGGYTDPKGSRSGIGSLLLGVHDAEGALHYAGNVGSGFDDATLARLKARLEPLRIPRSPFADAPAKVGARGDSVPRWVEPSLLAEVSFAQWTAGKRVRHAVFHGLRDDKPARDIGVERAAAAAPTRRAHASARVTHPERVVDASSGITKGELVDYFARVAGHLLPHLKQRPVALLRAPAGIERATFFQKHADQHALAGVTRLDPALDPGHEALLVVSSAAGVAAAAQLNTIEFHTWNMTARTLPRADRMVFDLDPGSGVDWPAVREAATLVRALLDEIGLASVLKTSGGKGLHVVVPLAPRHDWTLVRAFSQAVVQHLAAVIPQRFVAKSGPRNRVGRIFVDYLRNGWGATTVAAWSARARPGLGVSVPVEWSELPQIDSGAHWHLRNIEPRLALGNAPWQGAAGASRQTLARAMRALDFQPDKVTR